MNKLQIEKYFAGETSSTEEQEILQYFASEKISPELTQYQDYFRGLIALKINSNHIIPEEKYESFTLSPKNHTYYIKHVGVALAVAASFALLLLFFPSLYKSNDFVVINGKKYTDEKHIRLALNASFENVKIDMKQMFDDLDDDLFN